MDIKVQCAIINIQFIRGDTFQANVEIMNPDKSKYIPQPGDRIRFAVKKSYSDQEPVLLKEISNDSLLLRIESADTKAMLEDSYRYDIELTKANGDVSTFIKGNLVLSDEVM